MAQREQFREVVVLENPSDPQLAGEFLVLLDREAKTCEILCTQPYNEVTDKVLREFYDQMVADHGYTLQYANLMEGFTLAKFNRHTAELIGRPELADSARMKQIEAAGSICGIKEMGLLNRNARTPIREPHPEPCAQ